MKKFTKKQKYKIEKPSNKNIFHPHELCLILSYTCALCLRKKYIKNEQDRKTEQNLKIKEDYTDTFRNPFSSFPSASYLTLKQNKTY